MDTKVKSIIVTLLFLFAVYTPANATVYFYYDAENCANGSLLPMPPWNPYYNPRDRGKCVSDAAAPNGTKIMQWDVLTTVEANLNSISFNPIITAQTTYYFAFFFRFDRINGVDIWPEGAPDTESFDKAAEFVGDGVRWTVNFGERGMGNNDHRFSLFISNPTYDLNPEVEVWDSYYQNYNGYSRYNSVQLEYEKWHSLVVKMKWATDNTGEIGLWVDGIKVIEYINIKTAQLPGNINKIGLNGTYAQPSYNIPPHYRKFDAIIFTDNWQDIVDGGYLDSGGGDTQSPTVPGNLSAQATSSSQINLSWTASTDDIGVTGYRIYGCQGTGCTPTTQIATPTTTSYSNTGLSASTTYTYTVSADDAAGNESSQSASASATTSSGGGGGGDTGGNTGNSGGDSSASGGSGCGFVKDNGKGQGAKGEGLSLMIMVVVALVVIGLVKRTAFFYLMLLIVLFPVTSYAATLEVGAGKTYSTIQAAVDAAQAGDTVLVYPGIYIQSTQFDFAGATHKTLVLVNKSGASASPFTIKAAGSGVILDGASDSGIQNCFWGRDRAYVVIDGFECRNINVEASNVQTGAIYFYKSNYILIQNNTLYNITQTDYENKPVIHVQDVTDSVIRNNTITAKSIGIGAFASPRIVIEKNTIDGSNTANGMYISGRCDDMVITGNYVYNYGWAGIQVRDTERVTVSRNILYNAHAVGQQAETMGIYLRDWPTTPSNPPAQNEQYQVYNNIIDTATDGIVFWWQNGDVIKNNITVNVKYSVVDYSNYEDSSDIIIEYNIFNYSVSWLRQDGAAPTYSDTNMTYTEKNNLWNVDPKFVATGSRPSPYYELQSGSPAIEAGDPNTPTGVDFIGTVVPQGGGADIGAFEYCPSENCSGGGGNTPPPPSGSSGGDASASGGSGCGYIKDNNGKGQGAKGEGVIFAMILIIILVKILLNRKASIRKEMFWAPKSTILIFVLFLFAAYTPAHATVYFYFDAEDGTIGNTLPNPPICQTECSGSGAKGTYQSSGGAPQGSKYFQWQTVDNQTNHYTEIHVSVPTPIIGKTYYLAYYFNFSRINGLDIWHETGQSGDKGVELRGSGLRWTVGGGHWPSHADNQDHRYTMMAGNATYHLNPELEVHDGYVQNQSGYNANNPLQLQYEHWYSAVMVVKMATDNTGSLTVYIDGVKLYEYNNIKTVATASATIADIYIGGSIAQGAYDAPAHYRKYDALMLTDNWQDIVDGGYLSGGGGDTPPPSDGGDNTGGNASSGGEASGGSGCGYIKDANGKGQKAKGEGLALIMMLIITLAGIVIARKVFIQHSL